MFKLYTDVHEFYQDTYDVLMQNEAQNMILLGNLITGHKGEETLGWRDPKNWVMATVTENHAIVLVALMTPPYNITLYAVHNEANKVHVSCLIEGLKGHFIPGVTTEKTLAELFCALYTEKYALKAIVQMNQRMYVLEEVQKDIEEIGTLRLLTEKDMYFFPHWMEDFTACSTYGNDSMSIPKDTETYYFRLHSKKLYVLEKEGKPVSMAGFTREMQNAIGVAFVYTPFCFRGKGYASSCVAQLSKLALDKGYKQCVLYTDLSNPTSNSIYQKIGYKPICDSLMMQFENKE